MTLPGAPVPSADGRSLTPARIGIGRTGVSQTTASALAFALDHARARDAVHHALDVEALILALGERGEGVRVVDSLAVDRSTYLTRPDLGARLSTESAALLSVRGDRSPDLIVVLADGLSARALQHAPALLAALLPRLTADGWRVGPAVIARQGRVALGDEIGERLGASAVLVLIGERPGLSAADSLGAYLTWAPRVGRSNAERNCVSNIRPQGQTPADAAATLHWLLTEAWHRRLTGVQLKDQSSLPRVGPRTDRPDGLLA
jgi:ethanolamine ammonia-lyase small subunit